MVTSNRDMEFELIMNNHTGRHRGSGSLGGGGRPVYNITSSQRGNRWALGCVAQMVRAIGCAYRSQVRVLPRPQQRCPSVDVLFVEII